MSRTRWVTGKRSRRAERCERTVYLASGESGRCQRRVAVGCRYCEQHLKIIARGG